MYGWQVSGTYPTGMFSCYRPQQSFGKVLFLHLSVSHSVHGEGVSVSGLGRHPLTDTPQVDTPLGRPLGQTPLGRNPPGQTPLPAQWYTVNKRVVRIPLECILVVK